MEKASGKRVFWDGKVLHCGHQKLALPPSCSFPSFPFEGQLLEEQGRWSKLMVFDAPQLTEQQYSARLQFLKQHIPSDHSILTVVSPILCTNREHLQYFYDQVCKSEGEGVVLRKPTAWYYEDNSFLIKRCFEKVVVMKTKDGNYKWHDIRIATDLLQHLIHCFAMDQMLQQISCYTNIFLLLAHRRDSLFITT